jgi:O-antigen/teichoic acid export membrane protein
VLRVLALGQGAFALFAIATTVLSSLHRERWTMALNAVATIIVVGAAVALVPGAAPGAPIAARAALATSVGLLASLALAGFLVARVAGALVSPLTVVRVAVALVVAGGAPTLLGHTGKLATLGLAAIIGLVYLIVLIVTGELGKADLGLVKRVLGKRA